MTRRWFCTMLLMSAAAPALRAGERDARPATVPFEMLKSQHMAVQVKINGKGPFRLIFDTGAPVTLLSNKVAKAAGVFPENYKPPVFALFGAQQKPFKIKELEMGELKVGEVDTMVMDHPTVAALASVVGPLEGIVGFNVFARNRTTIDYQTKTMTFVPVDYEPKDMMKQIMNLMLATKAEKEKARVLSPAGLMGLRVDKKSGDEAAGVMVAEVFPGSPAAAAGLKSGDRLLTLDGRWTDSVEDCYFAASRLRPGTPVRAELLRDGKKIELQVQVKQGV